LWAKLEHWARDGLFVVEHDLSQQRPLSGLGE
jgi:hypothetical protein